MIPAHENDISWPVLRRIVQDWSGTSAELAEVRPLTGGCINTTLALHIDDGQRAVIKISPHRVNREHEREAYQLNLLRSLGLPTPRVYAWKIGSLDDPFSYLLMEFVEGIDLAHARLQCSAAEYEQIQAHLADLVLSLHSRTAEQYMRVMSDGDGGQGPQRFDSWPAFYRSIYDPIWREVEKSPLLPIKTRKQIGRLHDKLDRLLAHNDVPRLLHWDIWATNVLAQPDASGRWRVSSLLDPNCKYAHAEAEIAYMELFHTITPAFLKVYQRAHRLEGDYHRLRKWIYQLYPLIDHVHLFGQEYVKPLMTTMERLASVA
jgi:fructosamine-3-kinase